MSDMNGLRATRMLKKRWKSAVYTLISSSENLSEKRISHFGVDMAISKSEGIDQIVTLSLRFYRFKRLMRRSWMLLMMALLAGLVTWLVLKA
jgi:DNA-binding NarL/FixJ family response regulator